MDLLISEIRYEHYTLPECCFRAAQYINGSLHDALICVFDSMEKNQGQRFSDVYKREMKKWFRGKELEGEDKTLILTLFDAQCFADEEAQISMIKLKHLVVQHMVRELEEDKPQRARLGMWMGVMLGAVILLILM